MELADLLLGQTDLVFHYLGGTIQGLQSRTIIVFQINPEIITADKWHDKGV